MIYRIFSNTPFVLTTAVFTTSGVMLGVFDAIDDSVKRGDDKYQLTEQVMVKGTIGGAAGFCWPVSIPLLFVRNRMKKD